MIKYLGSKKNLTAMISALCFHIKPDGTVIDPFSGTGRVGLALKAMGHKVICGDHNHYAYTLGLCHVQADLKTYDTNDSGSVRAIIREMNNLPPVSGYFTQTFCEESRFFQPSNGAIIDAARDFVESLDLNPEKKAVLVTSIIEAADKVDSTVGIQMAYLKSWADRANNKVEFLFPEMKTAQKNRCEAYHEDAVKLVKRTDADIAYFDPPYNQHKYLGNYHIWETLSLWDKPATYGVAKKRIDCKDRTSDFNSKTKAKAAIETLIKSCKAPHIVLSYNNEGHVAEDEIKAILASARSELLVFAYDHKRHVGHKIGIFNQKGQKVGEESHARTTEYMFFATDDKMIAGRARRNMAQYLL